MSEPSRMRAYRACINLPGMSNGAQILIDDSDERWADWIKAGFIAPVGPPADYVPPEVPFTRDFAPPDLPVSEPSEMVAKPEIPTYAEAVAAHPEDGE